MSDKPIRKPSLVTTQIAEEVKDVSTQRGVFAYENMGEVVRMGELMANTGGMVPKHCQNNPAVCTGIALQAATWGLSPLAVAQESYQVKPDAPVAYGAKLFLAVARQSGIQLKFEYTGSYAMGNSAGRSTKGNETSKRSASGDLQCTAWAIIDGERVEYTTPKLDDVTIKNSPLWHNDPKQQMAYYAARNFMRLHAPDIMMGVMSADEAQEHKSMKDVTPREKKSGFAALAEKAKANAAFEAGTVDASAEEVEATGEPENEADGAEIEADSVDIDIDPNSEAFNDGFDAGIAGFPGPDDCPLETDADRHNWAAGYQKAKIEIAMESSGDANE